MFVSLQRRVFAVALPHRRRPHVALDLADELAARGMHEQMRLPVRVEAQPVGYGADPRPHALPRRDGRDIVLPPPPHAGAPDFGAAPAADPSGPLRKISGPGPL